MAVVCKVGRDEQVLLESLREARLTLILGGNEGQDNYRQHGRDYEHLS
jgi:hypothetical protein